MKISCKTCKDLTLSIFSSALIAYPLKPLPFPSLEGQVVVATLPKLSSFLNYGWVGRSLTDAVILPHAYVAPCSISNFFDFESQLLSSFFSFAILTPENVL